jgi:periplasmic protein TonB
MKKNLIFSGLLITSCIIGCQTKNTSGNENAVVATDSSMMTKENTNANNMISATDSGAAKMENTAASGVVKPDPSKKGRKGKVSFEMPTTGTGDMTPDKEGYYANAEILPSYPGGQKSLEKFFEKNLQYPQEANDNGVEGTVKMNFAVDENGKIYSPKITSNKIGYGLEEEALSAFSKMPKWTPGRIKGKNVKTRFTLPVKFQLSE